LVDLLNGPIHCVVAEIQCRHHSSVAWPDRISVGLRVARIGNSSVRYEIGVFRDNDDIAAAEGYFAHVFVERGSQKPASIRDAFRRILKTISTEEPYGPRHQRP
jgi:acyl-CoA thioester hydrolase